MVEVHRRFLAPSRLPFPWQPLLSLLRRYTHLVLKNSTGLQWVEYSTGRTRLTLHGGSWLVLGVPSAERGPGRAGPGRVSAPVAAVGVAGGSGGPGTVSAPCAAGAVGGDGGGRSPRTATSAGHSGGGREVLLTLPRRAGATMSTSAMANLPAQTGLARYSSFLFFIFTLKAIAKQPSSPSYASDLLKNAANSSAYLNSCHLL